MSRGTSRGAHDRRDMGPLDFLLVLAAGFGAVLFIVWLARH